MLFLISCSCKDTANEKVSSLLLIQIDLRTQQIADPTSERLEIMKEMGMRVDNLEIHRIFIYLNKEPSQTQVMELEAIGITVYLDSWIPPVGDYPTGFLLADMPINKLDDLASKSYVIRLDTAERVLEPNNGNQPQSG